MNNTFEPENHKYPASLFFEDLRVGETYYIPSRTLSDANFAAFQLASADNHPIHYDIEYCKNISTACLKSDLIIIHTEWNEFKFIDFKKIVKKNNFKVYDMRNIYDPKKMKLNKIKYFAVGRTV